MRLLHLASILALAGCSVGPDYSAAPASIPDHFKEAEGLTVENGAAKSQGPKFKGLKSKELTSKDRSLNGFRRAAPASSVDQGAWWEAYKDPTLDKLMGQVDISNQTIASAGAGYDASRTLIRQAQAALFPVGGVNYSATWSLQGKNLSGGQHAATRRVFYPQGTVSWDIDVWGKVRRQIESDAAGAQVSAADLANVRLSTQAQLALAYYELRAQDSQKDLLHQTVEEYKRTLEITQNQYNAGIVSKADLLTAENQVSAAQAQEIAVAAPRAQFEHAIAVLTGKPPADLSLSPKPLPKSIPTIPVSLPSALLERRPDIAAAERHMQQQNALIGVAVAAYYPDISLSGAAGFMGRHPFMFTAPYLAWSLGGALAEQVLDGGLRGAQVDASNALYQQSVADYRQTVLTAFQQVEDQLVALRVGAQELKVQEETVRKEREAVDIYLNQYKAGTIPFTTVVVAEATLFNDQEAALTTRRNLFIASVYLIQALGGGWDKNKLPQPEALTDDISLLPQSEGISLLPHF